MTYSKYKQQRIVYFHFQGKKPPEIEKLQAKEGMKASRIGIYKFLKENKETGTIQRRIGSGRLTKITAEIKVLVEQQMRCDDETTAHQLHQLISRKGYMLSLCTVLLYRISLGWTFRGSSYCQLIWEVNRQKRLEWAQKYEDDTFADVKAGSQ